MYESISLIRVVRLDGQYDCLEHGDLGGLIFPLPFAKLHTLENNTFVPCCVIDRVES